MVNRGMQKKKMEIFFQEASSINDLKRVKLARRYFLECFFFFFFVREGSQDSFQG